MDTAELIQKEIQKKTIKIEKLKQEIVNLQELCPHKWRITNTWNDHDGWSLVEIQWYQGRTCDVCGKHEINKSGTSKFYG